MKRLFKPKSKPEERRSGSDDGDDVHDGAGPGASTGTDDQVDRYGNPRSLPARIRGLHDPPAPRMTWGTSVAGVTTTAQVTSVIGWLCGSGEDDWETALRLSDDISTSTELSKEAARALRKELEHGQPLPQERAARLLVIFSRNAGERFRLQLAQKKFLDVVEKVLKSSKTQESVKSMLYKSLAVLAFEQQHDRDMAPLVGLYNKIKRPEDPYNGSELDAEDPVFSPSDLPQRYRSRRGRRPLADFKTEAQTGKSNAALLSEALSFTKPEDMDSNEIIQEFYAKCQESQSLLVDAIPLATQKALDARRGRGVTEPLQEGQSPQSPEEEDLASLQSANQDLIDVFRMHDDMQRKRREEADEREARERSIHDTRFNKASDALAIPHHGVWASGSSENLTRAGSSREGSRRGSAQDLGLLGADKQAPATKPNPMSHKENAPPPRPPNNPYATLPASSSPPQSFQREQNNAPTQISPPKSTNPFIQQALPAGTAYDAHEERTNGSSSLPEPSFGSTIAEEPFGDENLGHNPYMSRSTAAGPPRSPSAGFNPYTSVHQSKGSSGSNGSIRSSSTNPYTGLLNPTPPRPTTAGADDEELETPVEPSAKAFGKLRRMSMRDEDGVNDTDARQIALEEQLRERYRLNAEGKERRQADLFL